MAQQFQKRERYRILEVLRRFRQRKYYFGYYRFLTNLDRNAHDDWLGQDKKRQEDLAWSKRRLKQTVHRGICRFSREFFHPIWRNAGKKICRFYLIGKDTRAENLDPQPKRLGIMWYID